MMEQITECRDVWAVWMNTDLTEGRGYEYIRYICQQESTARRLSKGVGVQGGNGRVTKAKMYLINNQWYSPGRLIENPTKADIEEEKRLEDERKALALKEAAIAKARSLGLSDEDIAALKM